MPLSTMPSVILEHDNDLVDVVNGYVFTNLASSPPPQYVPGKIGNCITKTLPGYVDHSNEDIPLLNNFAGNFTMFGWVKNIGVTSSYVQFSTLSAASISIIILRYRLITANQVTLSTLSRLNLGLTTTTSTIDNIDVGIEWHFIALTFRASDARCRMFFDGMLIQEWIETGFYCTVKNGDVTHDADNQCINKFRIHSQTNGQKHVDQVGIAPVEYTADDIVYIYNNGNGRAYSEWVLPAIRYIDDSQEHDQANSIAKTSVTGHPYILQRGVSSSITNLNNTISSRFRDVRHYFRG